jgi:DNA modification methylase
MSVNKLVLGDNLEILKAMESDSIDLIYLDPPFFSNRNYEVIWGDAGEVRSFHDRWAGGIDHYIGWLKERVEYMHRILKPTGSIFLHCDWHADAYIRVDILDKIFGVNNLVNVISWKGTSTHNDSNNEGDVVLDAFMGGGTTIAVADRTYQQLVHRGAAKHRVQSAGVDFSYGKLYRHGTPGA